MENYGSGQTRHVSKPRRKKREPSVVGLNLKRIRLAKRMSQRQLGEAIGYEGESARIYISRIESGDVGWPRENLRALANALDVTIDELAPPEAEQVDLAALLARFKASDFAKRLKPPLSKRDVDDIMGPGRGVAVRPGADESTLWELIHLLRRTGGRE
jgi:transcriptional regulator with XRE-family HTH domain